MSDLLEILLPRSDAAAALRLTLWLVVSILVASYLARRDRSARFTDSAITEPSVASYLHVSRSTHVEVIGMAVAIADRRLVGEIADVGVAVRTGAVWGIIAAAVMAMYAMIAGATYLGAGFFTPLYHIASSIIQPSAMMTSMQKAMEGQTNFYFEFGPAAVGMMIHFMTGAIYGIVFALIARALRLSGGAATAAGAAFGVGVLLFSSFIGLPAAAALFDGGDPIADMPKMVGWTTFTIEHVMYGIVLGVGWLLFTRNARRGPADRA